MTLPADIYPQLMRALTLISQGRTITKACYETNLNVSTFKNYIRSSDMLQDLFTNAEQEGFDMMAEALLEIQTHAEYGSSDPKVMKVMSDNIKWFLAKKRPAQYSDRMIVETKITADKAIIEALERGQERALAAKMIENVTYTVVEEVINSIDYTKVPVELLDLI